MILTATLKCTLARIMDSVVRYFFALKTLVSSRLLIYSMQWTYRKTYMRYIYDENMMMLFLGK